MSTILSDKDKHLSFEAVSNFIYENHIDSQHKSYICDIFISCINLNLDGIEVYFNDLGEFYNICIIWEDKISNYRNLGLYGQYSTFYQKVTFDEPNNTLSVRTDNGDINITL